MNNEKLKVRDNVELTLTDKDGNIKLTDEGFSCTIIKKEDKSNAKDNIKRRD